MTAMEGSAGKAETDIRHIALPMTTYEDVCLPIAVNAVARYWDVDMTKESKRLSRQYPGVRGVMLAESLNLASRHGIGAHVIYGDMDRLYRLVDAAIPPIVIIPGSGDSLKYASAIIGYDLGQGLVMHYVPKQDKAGSMYMGEMPKEKFDRLWQEESRLMIVMAPPDVLPAETGPGPEANRILLDAEKHAMTGNASEAAALVRKALSMDGQNVTALLMMASSLNEQNSPDCIRYYKQCLASNPLLFAASRGLGNYYLKSRQYDLAEQYYTEAIRINPRRYGPVYKNRAVARLEQNDKRGAKSDLTDYLKYTPAAADADSIKQAVSEL